MAAFCGLLLMALYPLYALYKGELSPAPDRNSLLGTAQLAAAAAAEQRVAARPAQRHGGDVRRLAALSTGSCCWPASPRSRSLCFVRRLRPVALALAIGWLALLRGGYLPFMHVLTLLPWSALLVVGVLERVAGNGRLSGRLQPLAGWRAGPAGRAVRGPWSTGLAAVALAPPSAPGRRRCGR